MSLDVEAKINKAISDEKKSGAKGVRFQLLSLKVMSVSMDELFGILKKMKDDGKITFGTFDGPTAEAPATWRPDLYIYPV